MSREALGVGGQEALEAKRPWRPGGYGGQEDLESR